MGSRRIVTVALDGYKPTLNEYINTERKHRLKAAKLKKATEHHLTMQLKSKKVSPFESVELGYNWIRLHRREDKDNISFGQKFVQDALVNAGIIANDGWKNVFGFTHNFSVDKSLSHPKLILVIKCGVA